MKKKSTIDSTIKKIEKNVINKHNEIKKILDSKKNYKLEFIKKENNKYLGIYEGKKLLIAGNYNFYGIFQPSTNLWIWASSIPGVNKKHIKNIKQIKSFNYLFESSSDERMNFYYQLLSEDVILINNSDMLEWINELLLYLSNDVYYFNPENSEGNMQFITLINIKEKYL